MALPKMIVEYLNTRVARIMAPLASNSNDIVAFVSILPLFPEQKQHLPYEKHPGARFNVETIEISQEKYQKFLNGWDVDIRDEADKYVDEYVNNLEELEELLKSKSINFEELKPEWQTDFMI